MKHLAFAAIVLTITGCATPQGGVSRTSSQPGHGAISITITPNPIVARNVGGSTYEFPFDVSVRETGGHAVTVNRVTLDVFAIGGVRVGTESWDTAKIQSLGYPTSIAANGELRYHFSPRQSVSDDRVFGSVHGEVRVDGTDDTGTATSATTTVTVTK